MTECAVLTCLKVFGSVTRFSVWQDFRCLVAFFLEEP